MSLFLVVIFCPLHFFYYTFLIFFYRAYNNNICDISVRRQHPPSRSLTASSAGAASLIRLMHSAGTSPLPPFFLLKHCTSRWPTVICYKILFKKFPESFSRRDTAWLSQNIKPLINRPLAPLGAVYNALPLAFFYSSFLCKLGVNNYMCRWT